MSDTRDEGPAPRDPSGDAADADVDEQSDAAEQTLAGGHDEQVDAVGDAEDPSWHA